MGVAKACGWWAYGSGEGMPLVAKARLQSKQVCSGHAVLVTVERNQAALFCPKAQDSLMGAHGMRVRQLWRVNVSFFLKLTSALEANG